MDFRETLIPGNHYQGDVRDLLTEEWDLMIAHPPCTYLTISGAQWKRWKSGREEKQMEAILFVRQLMESPIKRIALENPVGVISSVIRKPDQIIQPYEFGEDASKRTCLWLKGLLPLVPTKFFPPRMVKGKPRWGNQTDAGNPLIGQTRQRAMIKSITYQGIADAMAEQWG